MEGYTTKFISASRELDVTERIALKQFTDCEKLDDVVTAPVAIEVAYFADFAVHNDFVKGDKRDYVKRVICDVDGNKYITGSEAFMTAMDDIYEELDDAEYSGPIVLKIFKKDSKNYTGKQFLTCSLMVTK